MKYPKIFPNQVYHATIIEHFESIKNRILIEREDANINLDFGKGFYTTTNKDQAIERARLVQEKHRNRRNNSLSRKHRGIVITFDLDIDLLYNLSVDEYKIFESPDIEWAEFIVKNRTRKEHEPDVHSYFWTYGGMADGNAVGMVCRLYKNGDISQNQLLHGYEDDGEIITGLYPYGDNYEQLVFHNELWVNSGVLTNPSFEIIPHKDFIKQRG